MQLIAIPAQRGSGAFDCPAGTETGTRKGVVWLGQLPRSPLAPLAEALKLIFSVVRPLGS